MKNKILVYILIVAVALIWGVIFYKIIATFGDDEPEKFHTAQTGRRKTSFNDYAKSPDTTQLLLNYPDPFGLDVRKDTIRMANSASGRVKTTPATTKPAINWDFVRYSGFIQNAGSGKLIALIQINGKETMLSEGETSAGVKLLRNLRDSIKIVYNGKTRFIPIKPSN